METVQRVVVLPQEPIGQVSPYLHGHFAEHLGDLIYPGIYVGEQADIPHTNGLRNAVIEALRPLQIPVLRWPGGCFADGYHWRDGIGPRERRPLRLNPNWGMAEEPNSFGTHEFIAFCRAIGAEPYFAGNLGSGTPAELRDWVEYCNFAGRSALADERRANGAEEPFHVRFWGIGNENWGCGGNMSPEEYAGLYSRFRTFVHNYSGTRVEAIACGPNGNDWQWTRRFFEHMARHHTHCRLNSLQGFAAHYYCGSAGTATDYTESQWLELLTKAAAIEGIITGHRRIMDEYDPKRACKLIVDEWGTWHPVEPGKPESGLYQQNTIRDACVAALTLDTFHNHADKVFMANLAQLVNVLQALLLVEGDRCIQTPTYHVFRLYQPHQGAQAVRFLSQAEVISHGEASEEQCRSCSVDRQPFALQAVHGSASMRNGTLCVTVVNTHPTQPVELDLELYQGKLTEVEKVTLAAQDMHAHNTFAHPNTVQLAPPQTLKARDQRLRVQLPAGSITRLMGQLG
ncbi:alpha-N-arabinofuranosidase [Thermosporothrix hazakensis]|uniref:non-reducing end alpha-L-arabinofuranosidase n=2 Tax=Thermosporothrix TaxID=768650 RepID=A0A326U4L6_THEHA|nr:alpha-L-arabinofuranosidase C-terminal domain-containing protein [Thermosporothrix hazakensis]PZW27972.1 alpha-N-arabinofuranosidase [Thermosporothrix hazakensis]BBH86902.1 alpha-L-arabinofuranosidase [Thermosporothrix sp. COM3]GCE51195.1 alpha-L-arabinofuranosidase [Thermosporothrix hazakensis]